jgi:hypothetical protein
MLNVRLDRLLALGLSGLRQLDDNLRENFIDTVNVTKVACQRVSESTILEYQSFPVASVEGSPKIMEVHRPECFVKRKSCVTTVSMP